ncbi:hypothetical protein NIES267_00180 [Calothrix parasitica NIES-267]|uniref:Uncharacterized protein n=1 Tax=Calothrix parasitica NIES-267 TaxID=1973488 RepID=A0A1Z4LH42_9CYAN|nr:hypothetical protein NIES267_00180 [Calothrix parasitica NIES-267]
MDKQIVSGGDLIVWLSAGIDKNGQRNASHH